MSKAKGDKYEKYREKLIRRLSEYLKENAATGEEKIGKRAVNLTDNDIHNREMDLAIKGFIDERQVQIRDALKRIDEGRYGMCSECDQQISWERLDAIPEATLCIDCQKKREKDLQTIMDVRDIYFHDQLN